MKEVCTYRTSKRANAWLLALVAMSASTFQACTDANFAGGTSKSKPVVIIVCKKAPCKPEPPVVPTTVEFSGDKKIEPIQNTKIWTVTRDGSVKRFSIEGDKATQDVTVNLSLFGDCALTALPNSCLGFRSYVTEGGFMGARSPNMFFIDPKNPAAVKRKNLGDMGYPTDPKQIRVCVASYIKDGQRYMVAAWGQGHWAEYPMDSTPPFAPKWDSPPTHQDEITLSGANKWGYSCFIDQQKKIFYSQQEELAGLDLNTYQKVTLSTTTPNASFTSNVAEIKKYTKSIQRSSYAVSGDSFGNVYNHLADAIADGYTSAYDKKSDTVWFSHRAGPYLGKIMIIDRKCLTTEPNCQASRYHQYSVAYNSSPINIGPMSALKDGRIAGLIRGTGEIYLMNLKDSSNIESGLEVVKIGDAGGDPYMYTDFTGATLYLTESEQTFKPSEMPKFQASKTIKKAVFKWSPTVSALAGAASLPWKNIKLEARCYSNAQSKPAYEEVSTVYSSDQGTVLNVPTCQEGKYEYVDVKMTQTNNDTTLSGIDTISVGFKQ